MTYAQFLEIRAALTDIKGWLREMLDALLVLLFLLITGLALIAALRPAVM
jgi:hypothetical protein